jgi:hypothetical protein
MDGTGIASSESYFELSKYLRVVIHPQSHYRSSLDWDHQSAAGEVESGCNNTSYTSEANDLSVVISKINHEGGEPYNSLSPLQ